MDLRPVFLVVGILVTTLAAGMGVPAAVDAFAGNDDWQVFALSASVTLFVGVAMALTCRVKRFRLTVRQAFVMATLSWVFLTFFASLPFMFSELKLSFADSFFEAMSGITTTGSTVIVGLDTVPPGILLWRALLQWLGGLGIIVMAIAIMPFLGVGGMQLFRIEAFDTGEKMLPRAAQISAALSLIYLALTSLCAVALWLAGMTELEAVVHAMTTLATGGYSTSDGSIGHFNNSAIDAIVTLGMIMGSLPFVRYLGIIQGDARSLLRDSQVRWFIVVLLSAISTATVFLYLNSDLSMLSAIRVSAFNITSVITGTGFATSDYWLWGGFAGPIFFYIMFVGGCAGSTTCGIKIFRFQVLWSATNTQFHYLLRPHGVFIPYYNGRPIPEEVITSVMSFFFMFGVCFAMLAMALGALGLDFVTAVSSAATAICNVGPGLGPVVGPAGNFQSLPDAAKWLLSAGMLLGRLELFTVLMLFSPTFWRG
ncbi:MAG: TrkH family potassium uptake protein [Rhodospirillales bacterium]|nr:TrkH family potassium uptake protein [Rhodospirillales bacterium]